MEATKIMKEAKWDKNTIYQDQLSFTGPDGFVITVARSKEGQTRKEVEEILIEQVQERYGA